MRCKGSVLQVNAREFAVRDGEIAEAILLDRPSETRWGAFARPCDTGEQERDDDRAGGRPAPNGAYASRDETDEAESDTFEDEGDDPDEDDDLDDDDDDEDDFDDDDLDDDDDEADEDEDD